MPEGPPTGVLAELYEAVLILASEQGRIEERLARVAARLQLMDIGALPPDARARMEAIRAELTRLHAAPADRGTIDQSRAVTLALDIVLLYDALAWQGGDG